MGGGSGSPMLATPAAPSGPAFGAFVAAAKEPQGIACSSIALCVNKEVAFYHVPSPARADVAKEPQDCCLLCS